MGGGTWSADAYRIASLSRTAKGIKDFSHDDDVKTGKAHGIHPDLDPRKVCGPTSPFSGMNYRESRDSDEHPDSLPIAVFFDVTGSMGEVPMILQKKLESLMDVIIAKAGIQHPQILVGAIGDAFFDRYPFQVGQFESDNRFDDQLRNMIIERGGGGQDLESYGLAWAFAAHRIVTDAWEKRGEKGFLITMGDEKSWKVTSDQFSSLLGIPSEADQSPEDLLAMVQERWDIYHIHFSKGTQHAGDVNVQSFWKDLLGERAVLLDNPETTCEFIAGLILLLRTAKGVKDVVADLGLTGAAKTAVEKALITVSENKLPAHMATGSIPAFGKEDDPMVAI